MNRFALLVAAVFVLLVAAPRVADAQWWRPRAHQHYPGCGHYTAPAPSPQVPELDPNAAAAALTLLAGGALLIRERRRRLVG